MTPPTRKGSHNASWRVVFDFLWPVFLIALVFGFLIVQELRASDISAGYTFSPGEKNITDAKLNAVVGSATISTTFFTAQPATATPAAADLFLIYSTGGLGFRKVTLSDTFATINPKSLAYDTGALTNGCVLAEWNPGASLLLATGPTNIWLAGLSTTNLAVATTASMNDGIVLWNQSAGVHQFLRFSNLVASVETNSPSVATNDPQDTFAIWSAASNRVASITVSNLFRWLTNNSFFAQLSKLPQTYGATNSSFLDTLPSMAVSHGLGHTPQLVNFTLLCITSETWVNAGTEIGVEGVFLGNAATLSPTTNAFTVFRHSTQLFCYPQTNTAVPGLVAYDGSNTRRALTLGSWKMAVHAVYFPP